MIHRKKNVRTNADIRPAPSAGGIVYPAIASDRP